MCRGGRGGGEELGGNSRMGLRIMGSFLDSGTDLNRQREEEDGSSLDEGTNRNRGFGTNMAMAQLGEKEDRHVRRGHYLHSQTSRHFTGQRKERALTCSKDLRAQGKALHLVLFSLHNYLRRWELRPISQVRKLRPRNTIICRAPGTKWQSQDCHNCWARFKGFALFISPRWLVSKVIFISGMISL